MATRTAGWTVETSGTIVDDGIGALPRGHAGSLPRLAERIEAVGLEEIGQPHVEHLQDKLREMRFGGRDGIARAICVTAIGRRVIGVHAFIQEDPEDTSFGPGTGRETLAVRAGCVNTDGSFFERLP